MWALIFSSVVIILHALLHRHRGVALALHKSPQSIRSYAAKFLSNASHGLAWSFQAFSLFFPLTRTYFWTFCTETRSIDHVSRSVWTWWSWPMEPKIAQKWTWFSTHEGENALPRPKVCTRSLVTIVGCSKSIVYLQKGTQRFDSLRSSELDLVSKQI